MKLPVYPCIHTLFKLLPALRIDPLSCSLWPVRFFDRSASMYRMPGDRPGWPAEQEEGGNFSALEGRHMEVCQEEVGPEVVSGSESKSELFEKKEGRYE